LRSGNIIDPSGGRSDLDQRLLRIVFPHAFAEDPLRLLRAVQFSARLGLKIESVSWESMQKNATLIRSVARERIIEEIRKLLLAPKPSIGFDIMRDTGLLKIIFPDVEEMIGVTQPQKNNEDVYTHTMKVLDASRSAHEMEHAGNLEIMFSALFHAAGKPATRTKTEDPGRVSFFNHQHVSTRLARQWLKYYKASTIGLDTGRVCHLVRHHMFETKPFQDNERAIRRFINKIGPDYIFDLIDLRIADKKGGRFPDKVYGIMQLREKVRSEINKQNAFCIRDLKLDGHGIIELGYKPGPIIGAIQNFLLGQVLQKPELNTKEDLSRILRENTARFTSSEKLPQEVAHES
jgi:tRNA nucleotidyltransferase/poly(A) polymerase